MENNRAYYLKKAEENLPQLLKKDRKLQERKILKTGDCFLLDLGEYFVGYFSFTLGYTDLYPDAPVRLKVKFCETQEEVEADFSSYKGGLSPTWLQEEIIHLDFPMHYTLPRRYAARYISVTVLYTPREIVLSDFLFQSVTSGEENKLQVFETEDETFKKIDEISVRTLKNCMQRVFEDGPKRDRRLWIGDLRLEALANYKTFQNYTLVRRCLYLFAAATPNESGFLPAYVYENPSFVSGYWFLQDYALLFVVSLCDYCLQTGDKQTFEDLFKVAKLQMDSAHATLDENGILSVANGCEAFIDWCEPLQKQTALHGVYLYALSKWTSVLSAFGYADSATYGTRLQGGRYAAKAFLCNENTNSCASAYTQNQESVHSVAWLILGGVLSGETAWETLKKALNDMNVVQPFTPYMHHYVLEAMQTLGKETEMKAYIKELWGAMLRRGGDTFPEVFVKNDPDFSPYGDKMINSACHAWSCTPCYFLRK